MVPLIKEKMSSRYDRISGNDVLQVVLRLHGFCTGTGNYPDIDAAVYDLETLKITLIEWKEGVTFSKTFDDAVKSLLTIACKQGSEQLDHYFRKNPDHVIWPKLDLRGANWKPPANGEPCFISTTEGDEVCFACSKHISKHFGLKEYRCYARTNR